MWIFPTQGSNPGLLHSRWILYSLSHQGSLSKGTAKDEMVGWHHLHNGHGFGWTPGVGDRQGGLACCGSWGRRVGHDWATDWTELNWITFWCVVFLFPFISQCFLIFLMISSLVRSMLLNFHMVNFSVFLLFLKEQNSSLNQLFSMWSVFSTLF